MRISHAIAVATIAAAVLSPRPATAAPGPPALRGEPDDEMTFSEIVEGLRVLGAGGPLNSPGGRNEAFDLILGHRPYPGSCATPLLLALKQAGPSLPEAARALIDRLGPGGEGNLVDRVVLFDSGAGAFRIRFRTDPAQPGALLPDDEDLDGVPDEARRIAQRLMEAGAAVVTTLEQNGTPAAPLAALGLPHDVEITDLPDAVAAWIFPGPNGPTLLLDREGALSSVGPALLRHQMAHLYQMSLTLDESPWWYEAHAAWVEDPQGRRAGLRAASVAAYLGTSGGGLQPDPIAAWEGAFLWPHYLSATGGPPGLLSLVWEEMAAVPGNNTLAAFDSALSRGRGTTLAGEVRSFRIWNLFTGDADDGNHYSFGGDLPGMPIPSMRTEAAALRSLGELPPLGASVTRLIAGLGPGGWVLGFSGIPGAEWDISIVTVPAGLDSGPRLAEINVDGEGLGSGVIPWRDLAAIIVVVQNLGGERPEALRYTLRAKYDPVAPFDLMSFAAEAEDRVVALRWSTERETDLAGWMIYRSRDPVSGFVPITTLQLPPAGGPEPSSYLFIDTDVRPGRKYYYLLQGVTREGFTEATHTAAVRLPPAAGTAPQR